MSRSRSRKTPSLMAGAAAVALISAVAWTPVSLASPSGQDSAEPQPAPGGVLLDPAKVAWLEKEAADRATERKIESDPALLAQVIADKAQMAKDAAEAARQEDQARAAASIEELCGTGPLFDAPPRPAAEFISTGGWEGVVGDQCVSVWGGYAGFDRADQGAVFIRRFTTSTELKSQLVEVSGAGSLTAAAPVSGRMELTSEDGRKYVLVMTTGEVTEVK